jgi:hypothetical protein
LKPRKLNIGTNENPQIDSMGYHWEEKNISKVVDMLKLYEDYFPKFYGYEGNKRRVRGDENKVETIC